MTGNGFFYIPIPSHSHAFRFHSFQFPFPSLLPIPMDSHRIIPIPILFPNTHAQNNKVYIQTVDNRATEKHFHRKLDVSCLRIKILKNTIQNTLKIRQKQFYSHPSGLVYSLMKIYNCKNKYQLSLFDPRDKIVL